MNSSQSPRTQFLDVPGGRLAYDVTGPDGAALVLCVAGMGDIRQAFRFTTPALVEAGYRVACMDQRGHGESSSGWASYGSPATGADMLALIRHLGGPAAIIGHSSSAAAAVWAAAEEPNLVSALVLLGPFARQRELSPMLRVALAAVTSRAAIWSRLYYPTMYKAPKPADFPAYVRALQANLREPGRMAATRGAMSRQAECFDRVADVSCPVRIVMGSKDPDFPDPAAEAAYAQQAIGSHTGTTLAMIEGAGHYPHAELPDATAAAVLPFLSAAVNA
jgi:pimeloyl-ACP methyl ester carboxylesterase